MRKVSFVLSFMGTDEADPTQEEFMQIISWLKVTYETGILVLEANILYKYRERRTRLYNLEVTEKIA